MPLSDKYILVRPGCPADTRFLFQPSKVISFLATIPHSHPHYFHTPNIKIFPHSQIQNISTLPISKQFHTPNIKIFSHSQYRNISKLTISKYFHNLNIKLFPHCQNRYIFTLLRNLIHTISNIKICHHIYFHTNIYMNFRKMNNSIHFMICRPTRILTHDQLLTTP